MRILPEDECARVYSGLGLSRAFRRGGSMAGCGAGAGFSSERLDPRMIPGCQLFACTDTSAHPTAVVFPADVVVNGAFAADASWTKGANWTIPTPYALHAAGSTETLSQAAILVVGNTYATRIVVSSATAGTVTVSAGTTAGTARGNGDFTETLLCAGNTTLSITPTADFDGRVSLVKADPRNVSQLTDLTGLGHHLVQATASKQPLWVPIGSGGVLRGARVADYMKSAFSLNQPATIVLFAKWYPEPGSVVFADGGSLNLATLYKEAAGATQIKAYAGAFLVGPNGVVDGTARMWTFRMNGASSSLNVNNGAPVVGNAGAANPGGLTIMADANGGTPCIADYYGAALYNRALSTAEEARLYRWNLRLRGRLAI